MIAPPESTMTTAYGSTIEAVAYGLVDGGTRIVTGYPGFHAQDILAAVGGVVSINERTAYSIAWGAALAGQRAAVVLKNVGLNDAADPFINSINLRTSAGLVVIVLDDIEVAGSQCRQDSRHFFDLAPGLWLEPISASHAYSCTRTAMSLAEALGVPIVIRLTNQTLRSVGKFRREPNTELSSTFRRDPVGCVAHPMNVAAQRIANDYRARRIARFVECQFTPAISITNHTVAVGSAFPVDGRDYSHFWTYPLPGDGLRKSVVGTGPIDVFESGSRFATEKIQVMLGRRAATCTDESGVADHSKSFRSSDCFDSLFAAIRSIDGRIVVGDLGSYTMDRYRTIDACLCYGASVAVAMGCRLAGNSYRVFCVTGDAAFLHSGKAAMEEAIARGIQLTIILIDNGGAVSTGGQSLPAAVAFTGVECVARVKQGQISVPEYRQLLIQLSKHPGISVLHLEV